MDIEYINHACVSITIENTKVLLDPWLQGPSWADNLWLHPKSDKASADFEDIDYLFFFPWS